MITATIEVQANDWQGIRVALRQAYHRNLRGPITNGPDGQHPYVLRVVNEVETTHVLPKTAPLLDMMRRALEAQVEGGVDPEDAAWDVVCAYTEHLSDKALEALVKVAFPDQPLKQVLNTYADADHESDEAIYQSALMNYLMQGSATPAEAR